MAKKKEPKGSSGPQQPAKGKNEAKTAKRTRSRSPNVVRRHAVGAISGRHLLIQLDQPGLSRPEYEPPKPVQDTVTPVSARIDAADEVLVLTVHSNNPVKAQMEMVFEGAKKSPNLREAVQSEFADRKLEKGTQEVEFPAPRLWLEEPGARRATVYVKLQGITDPSEQRSTSRHTVGVPAAYPE